MNEAVEDSMAPESGAPQYRRTADGRHAYRITAGGFTEIQRIGRRFIVHEVYARAYPEMVRIHQMLHDPHGRYLEITAAEWHLLWEQAHGGQ